MQNSILTVVYSHGRFGSPWFGFKIEALRPVALRLGINMVSIRYNEDMPVVEMEEKLFTLLKDDVNVPGDLVLLSSSRGAYISTRITQRIIDFYNSEEARIDVDKQLPKRHLLGQFLIAPAFYIKPDYYPDQNPTPAINLKNVIVHGYDDTVIDYNNSIEFSKKFKSQLYIIEGGHRMNSQIDKLCLLFENFLQESLKTSNKYFSEWLKENPQEIDQPDEWM